MTSTASPSHTASLANASNTASAATPPALEITGLKFRFDASPDEESDVQRGPGAGARSGSSPRPWLLDIPSLTLGAGEQMLLQAPSGRGKSTLLHLIAGITDLTALSSGRINVAGRNIHALHGAERDRFRGRHIGMVFQTFNLLQGFSALENVMAALMFSDIPPREHDARAMELLRRLGIERPHALPHKLSVGQQQRVAVARALACRPALVLADEPTASLDPVNAGAALDLMQSVCREQVGGGAALLLVSHDPSVASRFTRVEQL